MKDKKSNEVNLIIPGQATATIDLHLFNTLVRSWKHSTESQTVDDRIQFLAGRISCCETHAELNAIINEEQLSIQLNDYAGDLLKEDNQYKLADVIAESPELVGASSKIKPNEKFANAKELRKGESSDMPDMRLDH